MRTKSKKEHNGKSHVSIEALIAKAVAVEKLAAAAKKQLRLVKVEHKAARKALKQAKKAARRARKEAKLATKAAKAPARKMLKRAKAKVRAARLITKRKPEPHGASIQAIATQPAPALVTPPALVPSESRASA